MERLEEREIRGDVALGVHDLQLVGTSNALINIV
jgi:hypothetical protein